MPAGFAPATRRLAWQVVGAASLVMLLLLTEGRPWTLFASGAFSSDFYDAQAEALTHGRLAVDPAVASIEGIVRGGDTHIYYGILLALVRVPVALVTDSLAGQLTRLSIMVAYAVALVLAAHLAHAGQLLVRGETDDADGRWRVGIFVLAVAVSPALFAFGWVSVYHETELWAFTFALASLAGTARLLATPAPRWAYLAAAGAALSTTTRASIGIAVTCAALVGMLLAYRRSLRQVAGPALVAAAGVAVHAAVNTARFGGPWNLPVLDQVLTRAEPARLRWFSEHGNSFFGSEFVPSTLLQYLRPDAIRFERVVPFVRFGPPATELNGIEFESNTPATSLTLAATLLVVLAAAGVVWIVRHRRWGLFLVVGAVGAATVPTLAIGFVANRYLIDFLPVIALPAAIAVWLDPPARLPVRGEAAGMRLPVRAIVIALVVWGVVVNAALGVWWGSAEDPAFIEGRVRLDDRVFDSAPPGVVALSDAAATPLFGTVALDGRADGCRGVYVAGYKGWTSVERTSGDRVVTGSIREADTRLVDTPAWTLDLGNDGSVTFAAGGEPRILTTVDAPGDAPVDYTVVVDPVTREGFGEVGDTFFYLPESVLDGPPLTTDRDPGPLCELLSERLARRG